MNNEGFSVDAKQVLKSFADLTGKEQKKAYRNALRKAANILVKETKSKFRGIVGRKFNSRNKWNGKTLGSGIKLRVAKEATEVKVHIMGDFRLKFFEKGTSVRTLRKNGANRGSMKSYYFFKQAKSGKEQEIFSSLDSLITESINRVAKK